MPPDRRPATTPPPIDVLLIEDDEVVATLLLHALHGRSLTTDVAGDVAEALRLLSRTRYKVAIVDLILPGGTGFEILDFIRTSGLPKMHIAVVTGADAGMLQGLDRTLAKAVFFKPVDVDHFAGYVETLAKRGPR